MSRLRSWAGQIVPALALVATLVSAPGVGARRARVPAACAPTPGTLVAPEAAQPLAARSTGSVTGGMALDEGAGRVYINTAAALLALDAASGACLHTTPLDAAFPGPVAVDGRTHPVFAASGTAIVAFAGHGLSVGFHQ